MQILVDYTKTAVPLNGFIPSSPFACKCRAVDLDRLSFVRGPENLSLGAHPLWRRANIHFDLGVYLDMYTAEQLAEVANHGKTDVLDKWESFWIPCMGTPLEHNGGTFFPWLHHNLLWGIKILPVATRIVNPHLVGLIV